MKIIKDQRGFTIIELITSFSLTMVVLVFLFNVVVIMKEAYVINSTKSEMIVKQSLLSTALNEDLYSSATSLSTATCSTGYDKCYSIAFNDGTTTKLSVSTANDKIQYGSVIYDGDDFYVDSVNVCKVTYSLTQNPPFNSYLQIKIGIGSNLIDDYDFSVNVIHLYNSSSFTTSNIPNC